MLINKTLWCFKHSQTKHNKDPKDFGDYLHFFQYFLMPMCNLLFFRELEITKGETLVPPDADMKVWKVEYSSR